VDRHAHLGEGHVGEEGFRELVRDPAFADKAMVLETAKEERGGESMDLVNLRYLKYLLGKKNNKNLPKN
jgi:deoxyribonuclease-4